MSIQELWLLLPVLIISAGILVLMLQASWKRSCYLAQGICLVTLFLALAALINNYPTDVKTITILFEYEPIGGFFSLLLLMVGISVALLQGPYMGANSKEVSEEFYLLLLLSCLGAMLLVMSRHGSSSPSSSSSSSSPSSASGSYCACNKGFKTGG